MGKPIGTLHRRQGEEESASGQFRHEWLLIGERGAVQFVIWRCSPDSEYAKWAAGRPIFADFISPDGTVLMALDVGYHSPVLRHDGQEPMGGCHVLEGDCFYDGSGLQAQALLAKWANASFDEDVIWSKLELQYRGVFYDEYPEALDD